MIWEFECLEPQRLIFSILGSRFLKIYFLDLLFSRAHILRALLNIQAGEGSHLDGAYEKISASRFLHTGFYSIPNKHFSAFTNTTDKSDKNN